MNGKISPNELVNRKNDQTSKQCLGFEYELNVDMGDNTCRIIPFRFNKLETTVWSVETVIGNHVYRVAYDIPHPNMDLVMVAAFGLRNIQYQIEQEVQEKSIIDFTIGDATREM